MQLQSITLMEAYIIENLKKARYAKWGIELANQNGDKFESII